MPLFVVETITMFRNRYVIECNNESDSLDAVAMEEAEEFSQMYLGENIIKSTEISATEFTEMVDALNNYGDGYEWQPESGSPWLGDKLIHKVKYA